MRRFGRHTGHALAGTMIFLVLSMLFWAAAYQAAASHLRVEGALRVRGERAATVRQAMAWSLSLLETGQPPVDEGGAYSCRMIVGDETYVAVFTRVDPQTYTVTVRPEEYWYDSLWPQAPPEF